MTYNNKYIAVLIAGMAALSSCDNSPKFHVEGTIEDAKGSMLYLEAITLEGVQKLDSTKLSASGDFSFSAAAPSSPEFYALRIGDSRINFSIDSTETVTFTAKLPDMSTGYTVEGSENCKRIKEISLQQAKLQAKIVQLEKNTSMYPGDIVDSINSLVDQYKDKMKNDYIFKAPMEASAYYAVCQSITDLSTTYQLFDPLTNRDDVKCYAAVATAWDGYYPNAKRTEQICNLAIQGMHNTSPKKTKEIQVDESKIKEIGLIDISLPDINGKIQTLSKLKGKVVLLDFTMYSASQSAERTRMMRDLYDKYKDRGFEIYQVSLDNDMHFWKFSCENLPWVCVHETDGNAVNLYGVKNLPTFFFINRDNELVKRNTDVKTTIEDEILKLL
jgi:peroxiredoxin